MVRLDYSTRHLQNLFCICFYRFVITADIGKMYWLRIVTYVMGPAAFLPISSMPQVSKDECEHFPFFLFIIKIDFYLDNLMIEAETQEDLLIIKIAASFCLNGILTPKLFYQTHS